MDLCMQIVHCLCELMKFVCYTRLEKSGAQWSTSKSFERHKVNSLVKFNWCHIVEICALIWIIKYVLTYWTRCPRFTRKAIIDRKLFSVGVNRKLIKSSNVICRINKI